MTFHTEKNIHIPSTQSWIEKFIYQPHQLFFTSTIFFTLLIMSLTILSLNGTVQLNFVTIHSFGLVYAVFTNAFLGFLITVVPKYTNAPIINKKQYVVPWLFLQFGMIITMIGFETVGKLLVIFTIFYFNYIFYSTTTKGTAISKRETIILNILLFIGALFLLFEVVINQNLSMLIFFGYLISLIFIVAQKMIPAFYSGYTQSPMWKKPKYLSEISAILLMFLGITLQFELSLFIKKHLQFYLF